MVLDMSTLQNFELKKCPMCGSLGEFKVTSYGSNISELLAYFRVGCSNSKCGVFLPQPFELVIQVGGDGTIHLNSNVFKEAAEQWNRRV